MASTASRLPLILGIFLLLLVFSAFIPVFISSMDGTNSKSIVQTANTTDVITNSLNAKVTRINETDNTINVELTDLQTGEISTITKISEGNNKSTTIGSETITVENTDIQSSTQTFVKYTYPVFYGYPDGTQVILENLPLIVLVLFIILIIGVIRYAD